MKILRQLTVDSNNIYKVLLVENEAKNQLWFSSKTCETFQEDIEQIKDFLELRASHPGKIAGNFIFTHQQDTNEAHLIFEGNLFVALLFLKEISLESTEPAIDLVAKVLKDPDEIEFKHAFESGASSAKSAKKISDKNKKITDDEEDEKSPLLSKTSLIQ